MIMKRSIIHNLIIAFTAIAALCFSSVAVAGECVVTESSDGTGEGTTRWAVAQAVGGGCVDDDVRYRNRYQPFFPSATRFHVVRWTGSMDVYVSDAITVGGSSDGDPVVLVADDGAAVRLRGDGNDASVGVEITGSQVIVDHVSIQSFAGVGVRVQGDDNLIIRSQVLSNAEDGVQVTGERNHIVDSEIASNGLNGIVVGRSTSSSTCGSGIIPDEGRRTALYAVSVRDNGSHVLGTDCTASTDAASAVCSMIRLEVERCREAVSGTAPCDEPTGGAGDASCSRFWQEHARCAALIADAGVGSDASSDEIVEALYRSRPGTNGGFGVLVNAPDVTFGGWQPGEGTSVLYGVPEPLNTGGYAGNIRNNRSYGVLVNAMTPAWLCRDIVAEPDLNNVIRAEIAETTFEGNGRDAGIGFDNAIYISGPHPPRIAHVAAVGDERTSEYVVTGSVRASDGAQGPWTASKLNPLAVRVEVYLAAADGNEGIFYLAAQEGVEAGTGNFAVHIPNPLTVGGSDVAAPSFVVTYVDTEYGATAPFSQASSTAVQGDSDGDGLADAEEDIDGDGIVGPGESDPANPDTDGDGLTDGEERRQTGRIAALIASGMVFENVGVLDPANPDSDGDCLPDGLEVGITEDAAQLLLLQMRHRPHYVLSPSCKALLAAHSVVELNNVIAYDPEAPAAFANIAMMYDEDGATLTDPTSRDTDRDGIKDGEEDWNFSGKRDGAVEQQAELSKAYSYSNPTGGTVLDTCKGFQDGWLETDPINPDSDGDGLKDGDEGAVDNDEEVLGKNESSPLKCDTDDDGVPDGMEKRVGTLVNWCDSDDDGLADGIELGIIHPVSRVPNCAGLQADGTNMRLPTSLDPMNPDSDGDGLEDGVEDINNNGWVDGSESDPSVQDTDGDGVFDGVEATGDFDGDGLPDFDMRLITNGKGCSPPASMADLDCDDIPNARDEDSDNDGTPDAVEGGWIDNDGNGIPDMYDAGAVGAVAGGGGGGIPSVGVSGGDDDDEAAAPSVPDWALDIGGGGACSLVHMPRGSVPVSVIAFLLIPISAVSCVRCLRYRRHAPRGLI